MLDGLDRIGDDPAIAVEKLRVHRSIPLDDASDRLDRSLPMWVRRDTTSQVEDWLATARLRGGLLVVVGESSVGKTRLLYETAAAALQGWPVLAPGLGDGASVVALGERSDELDQPVVVWLDEMHRFVAGPWLTADGIPIAASAIRRLLGATKPVVILGSMWPLHHSALTATRPGAEGGFVAQHSTAADVLRQAEVISLDTFSLGERAAARELALRDPRLAVAVTDPQFGVTQALAGVPALMQRYLTGTEQERALLHAAIDAQRLGVPPPLSTELLTAAARGYLTGIHPTDDWIQPTLEDLSRREGPHDRATAPLLAIVHADRQRVIGYEVADYLLQYATRARRSAPIPDSAWQALATQSHQPDLFSRLGDAAAHRGLDHQAITLYERGMAAGGWRASNQLAEMLADRGDVDTLRVRVEAGDEWAASLLAEVLAKQGDLEDLRDLADAGDQWAASRLVAVLADQGNVDELRARADIGDIWAARHLSQVLYERGDSDGLQGLVDRDLAEISEAEGDLDELRHRVDDGDLRAAELLATVLAQQGDLDELQDRADAGDSSAADRLAELLAEQGDVDELRDRADFGDEWAAQRLAEMLAEDGDIEELRDRADAGDGSAASSLAKMLAEHGDVEELRDRADAGDEWAQNEMIELLAEPRDLASLREEVAAGTPGALKALRTLGTPLG